jgi:hypothetical protein
VFGGSCDDPHWHTDTVECFETSPPVPVSPPHPTSAPLLASSVVGEDDKVMGEQLPFESALATPIHASGWVTLPTRLPYSGGASAVTLRPYIFVFLHGRAVCRYDPILDSYNLLSALPVINWHCFDAKADSTDDGDGRFVYLVGGSSNGKWGDFAYRYDAQEDSWLCLPPMPQAKRRCACAIVDETLWRSHAS